MWKAWCNAVISSVDLFVTPYFTVFSHHLTSEVLCLLHALEISKLFILNGVSQNFCSVWLDFYFKELVFCQVLVASTTIFEFRDYYMPICESIVFITFHACFAIKDLTLHEAMWTGILNFRVWEIWLCTSLTTLVRTQVRYIT